MGRNYTPTSSPLCIHKAYHEVTFNFRFHFPEFKFLYHCLISYLMTNIYQNCTQKIISSFTDGNVDSFLGDKAAGRAVVLPLITIWWSC
jgi:hypothetical protein